MNKISEILHRLHDNLDDISLKQAIKKISKNVDKVKERKHLILLKSELEGLVDSKKVKYEDYIGNILIDKFD